MREDESVRILTEQNKTMAKHITEENKILLKAIHGRQIALMEYVKCEADRITATIYFATALTALLVTVVMIAIIASLGG